MDSIIEYRDDRAATNDYPRRIVSPTAPSACCMDHMERIGRPAFDGNWRFFYKRCMVCGYTVRCFYAPSLMAILETARQIRLTLAEMNLGTGKRKRRTRAEIEQEIAAALGRVPRPSQQVNQPHPLMPLRRRRPAPSPA
ncbi:MAG: hypothetical protein HYT85_16545 [candidate division NC10 bacterium]|nr:hypothetical protein [candidate division NC10 bacterium]MBI2116672.1 hypothetical protein [candidate division NC10 bacterium]MBI2456856.1 hypothetical protein [candidate division NC10 bacterium]MBI2560982.1 hypothetical protein [candidate division NC10 bacterium]MBI3122629.1 hypothetical protein [candidate division NC10 bacterium]